MELSAIFRRNSPLLLAAIFYSFVTLKKAFKHSLKSHSLPINSSELMTHCVKPEASQNNTNTVGNKNKWTQNCSEILLFCAECVVGGSGHAACTWCHRSWRDFVVYMLQVTPFIQWKSYHTNTVQSIAAGSFLSAWLCTRNEGLGSRIAFREFTIELVDHFY